MTSLPAGIAGRIVFGGPIPPAPYCEVDGGCWLWTGAKARNGYGMATMPRRNSTTTAHRVVWQLLIGPIPEGLVLDHLCRVRLCVNPAHLEPVTHLQNVARGERKNKTHCPKGHAYDAENTQITPKGGRACRTCRRVDALARYHRLKKTA